MFIPPTFGPRRGGYSTRLEKGALFARKWAFRMCDYFPPPVWDNFNWMFPRAFQWTQSACMLWNCQCQNENKFCTLNCEQLEWWKKFFFEQISVQNYKKIPFLRVIFTYERVKKSKNFPRPGRNLGGGNIQPGNIFPKFSPKLGGGNIQPGELNTHLQ